MGLLEKLGWRRPVAVLGLPLRESDSGRWIRIGGGLRYNRDMSATDIYETCDRAFRAWRLNPFVKRLTEMWVNFVVGAGLTFTANDERVQAVLDDFVKRNKLNLRMKKRAREAFLFGELICAPNVNVATGHTRLAFLDPLQVSKIELDPFDGDNPVAIVVSGQDGQALSLPIVREDLASAAALRIPELYGAKRPGGFNAPLLTLGRKVGRAFYLAFNSIVGSTRGTSDLLTILDWCAGTEDLLWEFRARAESQNRLFGVITIKGATPAQLRKYRDKDSAEYIPPPGTEKEAWAYANENITFAFVNPQLGASDIAEAIRLFKSMIEIGGGPPEHYLGQAKEMTYASAQDASNPFLQQIRSGQQEFTEFWLEIAQYVVDQKLIFTNELDGITDLTVAVKAPEVVPEDAKYKAELANQFTQVVVAWRANNWVTDEQAIDLMHQIAQAAGMKVKVVEQIIGPVAAQQNWAREALRRISNPESNTRLQQ
ncbi:hypothetical protein KKH18_06955 [bacterium]|nr:hypothetical protein [bacterium]